MGCNCSCSETVPYTAPLEIVIQDNRVALDKRPKSLEELLRVVHEIELENKTSKEVVLEYYGLEGITQILNDLGLQEAYVYAGSAKLVIGAKVVKTASHSFKPN